MRRPLILTVLVLALPAVLAAQERPRPTPAPPRIPEGMEPPAGKCRIWMDGVSPAQQPAPTDCHTALRQKPANGTVIFGPSERDLRIRSLNSSKRTTRALRADSVGRRAPVPGRPPASRRQETPPRATPSPTRRTEPRSTPRPTGRPSTRPAKPDSARPAPVPAPTPAPRRPDVPGSAPTRAERPS